jgi:hypothetical protein
MVAIENVKIGDILVFAGYSDDSMSDDDMIFKPGDRVRVEKINPDGGMVAMPADAEGPGDTVFPEELEMGEGSVTEETPTETAEPAPEVPAKAIKPKATKAKAKASKTKAEPAPEVAPETATEVAETRHVHAKSVQDILAEHDALDAAKMLVERVEETYYTLGGVLADIYEQGIYKSVGYDGKRGFADYTQAELGIQYRKAMYLIDIYQRMQTLGLDDTRLREIGWSKAKELLRFATAENFDDLVDYAKDHTREQLVEHLKTTQVSDGSDGTAGGTVKKTKLSFALFADQAETVTRAIDAAKNMAGSDDPNQALEYICAEWSQMTESVEVPLEDAIAHLQAKYGVSLVVAGADEAEVQVAEEGETVSAAE